MNEETVKHIVWFFIGCFFLGLVSVILDSVAGSIFFGLCCAGIMISIGE